MPDGGKKGRNEGIIVLCCQLLSNRGTSKMNSRIVYNWGNTTIASAKRWAKVGVVFGMVGCRISEFDFMQIIVLRNINARNCGENQNINGQYECKIFHLTNLRQIYIKNPCNWVAKFLFVAIGTNTFHNHINSFEFKIHR